ncbi:Transposon protein [Arachis hypogaea]|nr:Transposon protein [Arachis hypogaea]
MRKFSHRDTVCNKINNRGPVSTRIYPREVQKSSRTIQRKCELHHKISEFHPSITRGKVPVPAIQVKGHTVPPFSEHAKLRAKSKELTEIPHRPFDNFMADMQEYQERSKGKSSFSHEEAMLSDVNDLQSPPRVRTRAEPFKRRINDSVKLQPLQYTGYELSRRGLQEF